MIPRPLSATPTRALAAYALIAVCAQVPASQVMLEDVEVEKTTYRGWEGAYRLRNSVVELVVVPALGGRVLSYRLHGGDNILWENEAELNRDSEPKQEEGEWHNYGGYRLWVAPQEEAQIAGWCRSDDNRRCEIRLIDDSEIRLIAPPLAATGTQFTVELKLYPRSSRVRVRQRIRNASDKPIRWSVWDVTQVPPGGAITFPRNPNSRFAEGIRYWRDEYRELPQWEIGSRTVTVRHRDAHGKIGADSAAGWIAYRNHDRVYVKTFGYDPAAEYPDDGCSLEVYTCPEYAEMQVLSPLYELSPGEERVFVEEWTLQRLRKDQQPAEKTALSAREWFSRAPAWRR